MFVQLRKKILQHASEYASRAAGFTLIELLVVISIIGVLAVAVLATINPIEQINRSRDTRTRSDASQLNAATERYYATQELYPWNEVDDTDPDVLFGYTPGTTDSTWMAELVTVEEVKQSFVSRLQSNDDIWLLKPLGSSATIETCFRPVSRTFQQQAATECEDSNHQFTINGTASCVTTDGTINANNMLCLP